MTMYQKPTEADRLRTDLTEALNLLNEHRDDEPCHFDHNGDCQMHSHFDFAGPCPAVRTLALLDKHNVPIHAAETANAIDTIPADPPSPDSIIEWLQGELKRNEDDDFEVYSDYETADCTITQLIAARREELSPLPVLDVTAPDQQAEGARYAAAVTAWAALQ